MTAPRHRRPKLVSADRRSDIAFTQPPSAVWMLTVYLALLLAVPSNLTIGALGSIGPPSTVWGLVCLIWWSWGRLAGLLPRCDSPQPVPLALGVFVSAVFVSYALAQSGGLPGDEVSPSDSGLIRVLSWVGVVLVAHDGLLDRSEVVLVIRRFVLMSALFASLGIAQFLTGDPLIDAIEIPGLTSKGSVELIRRGEFLRSSATATHPLEYAVVLSAALPIALSLALSVRNKGLVRRWWPTAAISLAAVLSVSRSAIVGLAIAMAVLLPALSRRVVIALFLVATAGGLALFFTIPGLAGTIRGLFLGVTSDPSAQSRVSSYEVALDFVGHEPVLGRGFGTFLPKYQILDNQLLLLVVEVGAVGLVAFLAIAATGVLEAQQARRRATVPGDGHLMQALTAAIVSTVALFAFFDALSFPMAAGVFFLLVGISSAARPALEHVSVPAVEESPAGRAGSW